MIVLSAVEVNCYLCELDKFQCETEQYRGTLEDKHLKIHWEVYRKEHHLSINKNV